MTEITPERLRSLFRPRSVALVGASDKSAFSTYTFRNLTDFGFADRTHLVNRRGAEAHGQPTVERCVDIGSDVDVAFLMVPQSGTLDAMSDAAAAGINNIVILSSGYAEAGAEGKQAQDELVAHAASLDLLVLGPNHLGFANFADQIPVTSIPRLPRMSGPVALLSQSGASSSAMLGFANMVGVGLSIMVTLGNEAMITAGHVIDYLVDDDSTAAIAIFMETVREPEAFVRAATRAAEAGKAIVVLKAGSSELSARTAAAHTGALVGDDRVISAVFRDLGIIRVTSIEDMILTAGAAARLGRLHAPGIGVVSVSGGACDILADRAEDFGAPLPSLSAETSAALAEFMPEYGTVQNPLDTTGAAVMDTTMFTRAISIMSKDRSIGVVAAINAVPWYDDGFVRMNQTSINAIGRGMREAEVPCAFVTQTIHPITEVTRASMEEAGIEFVLPGLTQAVTALANLGWWSRASLTVGQAATATAIDVPPQGQRTGAWSEASARLLLDRAGIPVVEAVLATDVHQVRDALASFDGPVAMKICSPDILHKSDIGGVRLGVVDVDAAAVFEEILAAGAKVAGARIEGVLITPMRSGGLELLVGVVQDPQWGPVIAVALGGIFVEVLKDSALSTLPITPEKARTLLESLRGAAVLRGVRGTPAADLDALSRVVARIGDLAVALGDELESIEINPLRVDGSQLEALDAVVTWRDQSGRSH